MIRPAFPPPRLPAVVAGLLGVILACRPAPAQKDENLAAALRLQQAFVDVISGAEDSVVAVARYNFSTSRVKQSRLGSYNNLVPNDFGSGVLLEGGGGDGQPLVLTNYHLVRGGPVAGESTGMRTSELRVTFHDRRRARAVIRAADPRSDLAVLELQLDEAGIRPSDLIPFTIRAFKPIKRGHMVVLLGNPYAQARDGSASASWGMVSNIARRPQQPATSRTEQTEPPEQTIHHFGTLLQIDARLNLGSSGGALLNLRGELIGITTALAALEGYEKSAGYAIPFDSATRRVIDSLKKGYEVEYGFLGVQLGTSSPEPMPGLARRFEQQTAARVTQVIQDSPADYAGLADRDLILSVNGTPVHDGVDLMREVGLLGPEATARLRVWRERTQQAKVLDVRLGKWPVKDDEGIIATKKRYEPWRGIHVDYATSREEYIPYRMRRYPQAVVVTAVDNESPAADSELDLKPGDFITHVNGIPVRSPREFHRVVSRLTGAVNLQLAGGRRLQLPP